MIGSKSREHVPVTLETLSVVRDSQLLREFSDEDLDRLARILEMERFPKGSHVCEQDEEGGPLFLLVEGQVGVIRKSGRDKEKERMLAVVERGECIGDMSLADGGPRSATVVALTDVRALELSVEQYEALRTSDPKLAIKVVLGISRLLSKRIREINKNLEIVHYWMYA